MHVLHAYSAFGIYHLMFLKSRREISNHKSAQARFAMSAETLSRLKSWFGKTSDSVLTVRDGLDGSQIAALRNMVEQSGKIRIRREKE